MPTKPTVTHSHTTRTTETTTMSASASHTMLISVQLELHREERMFSITSKDVPGLFMAGCDLLKLAADLPAAIKLLFKLNYNSEVEVFPATEGGQSSAGEDWLPFAPTFVALPLSA